MIYERKPQDIWQYIGSAWDKFEDKATIENFWTAIGSGIDRMSDYLYEIQKDRSLPFLTELIDSGPVTIDVIYSGINQNTITVNNSFEYPLEMWTVSVPYLYQSYQYGTISGLNIYIENTDYTISGYNYLFWKSTSQPKPDPRFRTSLMMHLYAPTVYRLNPILMNTWARLLGLRMYQFTNYSIFQTSSTLATQARHLKYFIWALNYFKSRVPTIKNLKLAYGVARGMPFAYTSGYTIVSGQVVTCGGFIYTLPSGLIPIPSGTWMNQFDLLASGLNLWDNFNNPSLLRSYSNSLNAGNTLVFQLTSAVKNLSFDRVFFNTYMSGIIPSQIQYFEI